MKARKLNVKAGKLQDEIISAIIDMMYKHNAEIISFVNNGDYSDFDVDRSFAYVDESDVVTEKEIIAIYSNGRSIQILCDNDNISSETINQLDGHIIIPNGELAEDIYNNADFITIDSTFAPTDTLLQLIYSVEETLENVLTQSEC